MTSHKKRIEDFEQRLQIIKHDIAFYRKKEKKGRKMLFSEYFPLSERLRELEEELPLINRLSQKIYSKTS